jgi:MFS family permease
LKRVPKLVILFGIVSLFADMTYEGGRSILGPYLDYYKATGLIAGSLSLGELLMHISKGLGGLLAAKYPGKRARWIILTTGYIINLASVPLLAYAGGWTGILLLVLAERTGKGLRTPVRDALIAEASREYGRGKAFGIHEALDQVGAVLGPLYVGLELSAGYSYREAYLLLAFPALASLVSLIYTYRYGQVATSSVQPRYLNGIGLASYIVVVGLFSAGIIQWSLISYAMSRSGLPAYVIAYAYALTMGIDAVAALGAGWVYDKMRLRIFFVLPLVSLFASFILVYPNTLAWIVIGLVTWGILIGMQESVFRAAIGDLVSEERLAGVYGAYGLTVGLSGFAGNTLIGYLLDIDPTYIPVMVAATGVTGLLAFLIASRHSQLRS